MNYFKVVNLHKKDIVSYKVQDFLLNMIEDEFGFGYRADFHQDITNMEDYYLKPHRNSFFLAINPENQDLIGTIGIRAYDKNFPFFEDIYHPLTTASIWRVFVSKAWRRNGVASALVSLGEEFCLEKGYEKIYLHTHKNVPGSLDFWLRMGYHITIDTENGLGTVHMEKMLGIDGIKIKNKFEVLSENMVF